MEAVRTVVVATVMPAVEAVRAVVVATVMLAVEAVVAEVLEQGFQSSSSNHLVHWYAEAAMTRRRRRPWPGWELP